MNTAAPRLGTDYALGMVLDDDLEPHSMRLTPSDGRIEPGGADKLISIMAESGVRKFWMVPVPEHGSALTALKLEVEREEKRLARYTYCSCGSGVPYRVDRGETCCAFCRDPKA